MHPAKLIDLFGRRGMLAKQAEALMGFANGHTRRAGPANGTRLPDAGRRQMLGNAFQTDTVAHLLGPLKVCSPSWNACTVLSD